MTEKKLIIVLFLLMMAPLMGLAQNFRTVKVTAVGSSVGSDVRLTKYEALKNAKLAALNEAGIADRIHSISVMVMGDTTLLMKNAMLEVDLLELDGKLHVKETKYDGRLSDLNTSDQVIVNCTIEAEVDIAKDTLDENFQFRVAGLKDIYREGDLVSMDIIPYADSGCYMRIFWFNILPSGVETGDELFPGKIYNDQKLEYGETYHFPGMPESYRKKGYNQQQMKVQLQDGESERVSLLFFVALKKKIRYDERVYTYEDFIKWIMKIPANERSVVYYPVRIVK